MRKSQVVLAGLLILALAFGLVAVAAASPGQPPGQSRVVAALGVAQVQGQQVLVEVVVQVPSGQDAAGAARAALQRQGARPFSPAELGSEGFTLTGLVWDNFPVIQYYNDGSASTDPEPSNLTNGGQSALTSTHATWNDVSTSRAIMSFGGLTTRCPSLVAECPGGQFFDQNNDVAWLDLGGPDPNGSITLGVTWSGTGRRTGPEADMALTTNANVGWADDGFSNIDVETVYLHENGHVLGLGHSDDVGSILQPFYGGVDQDLGNDDEEGITYLYDVAVVGSVSGTVTDTSGNPLNKATVKLEGTSLSAKTGKNGAYTIQGVPDPVTYTVTASKGGFQSETILRKLVSGPTTPVDFSLTPSDDTGGGGGGGACPPAKAAKGKC